MNDSERKPQTGEVLTDIHGRQVKIADLQTFTAVLHEQFPRGLTMPMPDEDLQHLLDIKEAIELGEEYMLDEVTFSGQIESVNRYWVSAGTLKAELRLTPDMYERIAPVEEEYPLDVAGADWMDWEDRAATRLLQEHPDSLIGAKIEVTIREDILPYLYIENRPYLEAMKTMEQTNCINESEFKQLLNLQHIYENGLPKGGSIPKCIQPLFKDEIKRMEEDVQEGIPYYSRKQFEQDILAKTELLLKKSHALSTEMHNLVGIYKPSEDNSSARKAADLLNRLYAPEKAFAWQNGNQVEVSIHSINPAEQVQIKKILRQDMGCIRVDEHPFKHIGNQQKVFLLCTNGQIVKGYMGLEGLNHKFQYGLNPKIPGRNYTELTAEYNSKDPVHLIATDDRIHRFRRTFKGESMPVRYMVHLSELEKHQLLQHMHFAIPDEKSGVKDQVWLTGRIAGETAIPKQLIVADTQLLHQHEQYFRDEADPNLIKTILCEVYYKDELEAAWTKEQASRQQMKEHMDAHQQQMARITDARLYGKVDNIQVRCKIDGVQQMGRPITAEDALKYAGWKQDAAMLGKDTLNYKNWLHQDCIKEIAAHAFEDVLSQKSSQIREQGIKR